MPKDLLIPVYLNQRIVFDLLAMLEDGICQVTRIDSATQRAEEDERRYGSEFGLGKALASLLSINISGERKRSGSSEEALKTEEERIHTPASLFYRLRGQLRELEQLKTLSDSVPAEEHDLVEFNASMSRNPLIHTMDSLISLMEMALLFTDQNVISKKQLRAQGNNENARVLFQMTNFREKLKSGDTVDLLAEGISGRHRAIVTLETGYLNDPTMADLVDGKFTVVGKVIRTVKDGQAISLIRKSALTMMPKGILEELMKQLGELSSTQGFNMPDLCYEVQGPAFQIIPIAIFA